MTAYRIKRVYEDPSETDGFRVLVDRLWPRGMGKERLHHDLWAKDLAPSTEARKAFAHKAQNLDDFRARYLAELDANPAAAQVADQLMAHQVVTLLYAAKDPVANHAAILRDWLASR